MFDTFREPHFFTFNVIFSHIASIFTFSVEFFSHLATFSHIAAFSHLRVPQGGLLCKVLTNEKTYTARIASSVCTSYQRAPPPPPPRPYIITKIYRLVGCSLTSSFVTFMGISANAETRGRETIRVSFRKTSRGILCTRNHREFCTLPMYISSQK